MTKSRKPSAKAVNASPARARASAPPSPAMAVNSAAIRSLAAAAAQSKTPPAQRAGVVAAAAPTPKPAVRPVPPAVPPATLSAAEVKPPPLALTPTQQLQRQGLDAFECLSRFQYAWLGDCLELGLTQLSAGLSARTPLELTIASAAATSQFNARQQTRLREWVSLAATGQQSLQRMLVEATERFAHVTRAP